MKEILNIIVYEDNSVELIVNGQKRAVTSIKFTASLDDVPRLETKEDIIHINNLDKELKEEYAN